MFREAVARGHGRLWKRDDILDLEPGTRSRVIRDYIASELRRLMDGRRGIHVIDGNQTTLFCIGQNWAVQVHKFDDAGDIAKNYTQASMDLRENVIDQACLPNVPEAATVLFLGYVNTGDPERPLIRLYCPGSGDKTWMIDLGDGSTPEAVKEITPTPNTTEGTKVVINPVVKRKRKQ